MRNLMLTLVLMLSSQAALAADCEPGDLSSFNEVQRTVGRVLSFHGYSGWDEKALIRAGDLAAIAVMKTVTVSEMASPERTRDILLVLQMAFEAPQLISGACNKIPTATLVLLDELERTDYGRQPNVIANVRFEVEHAAATGQPFGVASDPELDTEHTQWIGSVIAAASDIKPGMTRADLLRVFRTEGGISTRTLRTYVLKNCPYIKVDAEFVASKQSDPTTERLDDKILKISKPYLEYSHMD